MLSDARPRIPLKGPILVYSGIALSLAVWGHFARKHVDRFSKTLSGGQQVVDGDVAPAEIPPIDLGSARGLEEQLAPYMPTAALESSGLLELVQAPHAARTPGDAPTASYLMNADELGERRDEGYVYPLFDTSGRHGVPFEPSPRNVTVQLVDARGEPLLATSLAVKQTGDDGTFTPNAYRSGTDPTCWTIGSPQLTPGAVATFELSADGEAGAFFILTRVGEVPGFGDIDLGSVHLGRVRGPEED